MNERASIAFLCAIAALSFGSYAHSWQIGNAIFAALMALCMSAYRAKK